MQHKLGERLHHDCRRLLDWNQKFLFFSFRKLENNCTKIVLLRFSNYSTKKVMTGEDNELNFISTHQRVRRTYFSHEDRREAG